MRNPNRKIGLALSGGGYRAAAFHLGTLKKLYEMKVLEDIDVISTISGGSIAGACYCLHKGDYDSFHEDLRSKVINKSIIGYVFRSWIFIRLMLLLAVGILGALYLTFTDYAAYSFLLLATLIFVLIKYQYRIFPVSDVIAKGYDKYYYNNKVLPELKRHPVLAIGSSNLHTGRPFTFSQNRMGDSSYDFDLKTRSVFDHQHFPVSKAVMASSCVPFAFSPIYIDKRFYVDKSDSGKYKPVLVDGGVYDNQGIHKLTQRGSGYECDIIITSDAGGSFKDIKTYPNAIALLIRTVDLFMYRIKTSQMIKNVYDNRSAKPIAYFSLGWDLDRCIPGFVANMKSGQVLPEVLKAHELKDEWIKDPKTHAEAICSHLEEKIGYAAIKERNLGTSDLQLAKSTGTNLTKLSAHRVDCLIQHAENLTELQVKLYCPVLFT